MLFWDCLFLCSICRCFCKCHTVFITGVLYVLSKYSKFSNLVFFKIALDLLASVYFHSNFIISLSNFYRKIPLGLWTVLNTQMNSGGTDILTTLSSPVHEHSLPHLLDSSLASLCSFVVFSIEILHFLLNLFLLYALDATVNGTC